MTKHLAVVLMCALGAPSAVFAQGPAPKETNRDVPLAAVPATIPSGPLWRAMQVEAWRAAALERASRSQSPAGRGRVTGRQAAIIALSAGIAAGTCYLIGSRREWHPEELGAGTFYCGIIAGAITYGVILFR